MKDVLEKIIGAKVREVIKLHGDASYRTYYRMVLADGSTRIAMRMPHGISSASEEITNFNGTHLEPPFINICRFLGSLDLPVPKIYSYSDADRIMILEDIGDRLLAGVVSNASADVREKWYKKAIDLLVEMQRRTSLCAEKEKCAAFQRSFDACLLNWEFDHFREYLIEERSGKKMKKKDKALFEEETRRITEEILAVPYCFTHRDFQSRNLMVGDGGRLVMIDFQDALMGPCVYDLVSLLRDSYVELEWGLVEKLIEYYHCHCERPACRLPAGQAGQAGSEAIQLNDLDCFGLRPRNDIFTWFNLVTIQRKMKDAGRFVYIDRVKKNPGFMQYIPVTLGYVKNAFTRTPEHQNIITLLEKYVPEFSQ